VGSAVPPSAVTRLLLLLFRTFLGILSVSLLVTLLVAGIRWNQVRLAEQNARLLVEAWRFDEACDELRAVEAWSRCFPGFFTENALLQIQGRTRQGRWREAWPLAEAVRKHLEQPLPFPLLSDYRNAPLLAIQRLGLALIGRLSRGVNPPRTFNAWAGYEAILEELVAQQNDAEISAFQEAVTRAFPRSPIAIKAAAAPRPSDRKLRRPVSATSLLRPQPPAERVRQRPPPTHAVEDAPPQVQPDPVEENEAMAASWGIVTNREAFAYHPRTSAPVRPLHAGDVVALERLFTLRNQRAAEGTLILTNGTIPELAFLLDDLEIRPGSYTDANPHEVMWRSRLARLLAEEAALRTRLARESSTPKPELTAYEEAVRRLETLQKNARAIQAQLDQPGANRSNILEQLRAMKYKEAALAREVQSRKEALEKSGGSIVKRLEAELQQLAREIQEARQALNTLTSS
jgi:hypothetical protein